MIIYLGVLFFNWFSCVVIFFVSGVNWLLIINILLLFVDILMLLFIFVNMCIEFLIVVVFIFILVNWFCVIVVLMVENVNGVMVNNVVMSMFLEFGIVFIIIFLCRVCLN